MFFEILIQSFISWDGGVADLARRIPLSGESPALVRIQLPQQNSTCYLRRLAPNGRCSSAGLHSEKG